MLVLPIPGQLVASIFAPFGWGLSTVLSDYLAIWTLGGLLWFISPIGSEGLS